MKFFIALLVGGFIPELCNGLQIRRPVSSYHNQITNIQVRPFITDDARVVGNQLWQLESWTRFDEESSQHWILAAAGPASWLEVTAGGVWGFEETDPAGSNISYALPLLQGKLLVRPYQDGGLPGVGFVAGTFLPGGTGTFKPRGYGTFSFLTITQQIGANEWLLLHANAGFNYLHVAGENEWLRTWGLGAQWRAYGGFHLVGEVFSGDPYVPGSGESWQFGFRHFFNDAFQIDATAGKGIGGAHPLPLWVSAGIRVVFSM